MQLIHSGYKHISLDITLEIAELRNFSALSQEIIRTKPSENVYQNIKQLHFIAVASIMKTLETEITNAQIKYVEGLENVNNTFYNEAEFEKAFEYLLKNQYAKVQLGIDDKKDIKNSLENQKSKPLEWIIVRTLAHHFFEQSAHDKKRIRFFYDDKNHAGILKIDSNDDQSELTYFSELLKQINSKYDEREKTPFLSLASFNSELNYLRIRSLANKNLCEFEIVHKCSTKSRGNNDDIAQHGSIGLINETLKKLFKEIPELKIYTVHVKNLRRKNRWTEEGNLQINGSSKNELNNLDATKCTYDLNKHLEDTFKKRYENSKFSSTVHFRKKSPFKVFISYRQYLFNGNQNKEVITLKMREAGLEPIFSKTNVNNITENVVRDLNDCDACIQIYTLSPEEINNISIGLQENFIPDHSWLLFEYGLAVQKQISIGRMIDVTHYPRYKWDKHLRFNREKLLMEFISNIYDSNFLTQLDKLASEVRRDIEIKNK